MWRADGIPGDLAKAVVASLIVKRSCPLIRA